MAGFRPIRPRVKSGEVCRRRDPLDDPNPDEECPHCGADVPRGALSCPDCGSDAATGWSEAAGFELPEDAGDSTGEAVEFRRRPRWVLWFAAAVLVSYAIARILTRF